MVLTPPSVHSALLPGSAAITAVMDPQEPSALIARRFAAAEVKLKSHQYIMAHYTAGEFWGPLPCCMIA